MFGKEVHNALVRLVDRSGVSCSDTTAQFELGKLSLSLAKSGAAEKTILASSVAALLLLAYLYEDSGITDKDLIEIIDKW